MGRKRNCVWAWSQPDLVPLRKQPAWLTDSVVEGIYDSGPEVGGTACWQMQSI